MTTTMQGFTPVTADGRGVQVDKDALLQGAIVRYMSARWVDTARARGFIHTFKTRGGMSGGQLFSVWGTGELNDMLRKVTPGSVLYLQYGGKHPHPELPGAEMHKWVVQTSRAKEVTEEIRGLIRERASIESGLDAAISEARQRASERFEQQRREAIERGEEPPPHTDDDLPF